MKIFKATRKYEKFLSKFLEVVADDLKVKQEKLAADPFVFLRGTFYRWMQLWPVVCKKEAAAPIVLSVGDLHAANFGTWRDAERHLVWGVNDFDEAAPLPYTQDLIRLAASVELADEIAELKIKLDEACAAILAGYRASLEAGGHPYILDDENEWLHKIYQRDEKSAAKFWHKMDDLPTLVEINPKARAALEAALPSQGLEYTIKHRQAGMGSLGRPRYTALAVWQDERVAREVKPLIPSAVFWADKTHKRAPLYYEAILNQSVRARDPVVEIYDGWIARRLAPDSRRIELSELGPERDEARMLYAMGWETANIHLGTPDQTRAIFKDLKKRKAGWLVNAARDMAERIRAEHEMWKKGPEKKKDD